VVEFDVDSMSSSLEERAEDNDVKAQWKLAVCYRDGLWPVKTKDIGQAVEWYKRAAANGSANAMLELGNCY
jgi:TPR repeat protein